MQKNREQHVESCSCISTRVTLARRKGCTPTAKGCRQFPQHPCVQIKSLLTTNNLTRCVSSSCRHLSSIPASRSWTPKCSWFKASASSLSRPRLATCRLVQPVGTHRTRGLYDCHRPGESQSEDKVSGSPTMSPNAGDKAAQRPLTASSSRSAAEHVKN